VFFSGDFMVIFWDFEIYRSGSSGEGGQKMGGKGLTAIEIGLYLKV
jgi:hypothetical protein